MEKGTHPSFFDDGLFMERFRQLQQDNKEKERERVATSVEESKPINIVTGTSTPKISINKSIVDTSRSATSGGKLAFSLKQRSKFVAPPVKLGADEDEDETDAENGSVDAPVKRQKLGPSEASEQSYKQVAVAPPTPINPTVKKVADKLASLLPKMGGNLRTSLDKKSWRHLLNFFFMRLVRTTSTMNISWRKRKSPSQRPGRRLGRLVVVLNPFVLLKGHLFSKITPASALYQTAEEHVASCTSAGGTGNGESSGPSGEDPIAMMEFYMKKAAQEERKRQPKHSTDQMPPPPSLQGLYLKEQVLMSENIYYVHAICIKEQFSYKRASSCI